MSLECHHSIDGKCKRKPNPLEVLKAVNINWKIWQCKIHCENRIEVDVKVKAVFFFSCCFSSYYSEVWVWSEGLFVGNLSWVGEFDALHH